MTAMALEPQDGLLETFFALDTPEGVRAELVDGEIIVTAPSGRHERIVGRVIKQVLLKGAADVDLAPSKGLITPAGGGCTKNFVIPDATFAFAEIDLFDDPEPWMPADGVLLVLEVTSTRPEIDRGPKRHCYARAGIPLYLLVDQTDKRVTLFSGPKGDDYQRINGVAMGEVLKIPEPFAFELDTSQFA
jgi:Uma2 family endonuclease